MLASLVEPFDKHEYNTNMSVAENLSMGAYLLNDKQKEEKHHNDAAPPL